MKLFYSVAFGVASFFALNCGSGEEGGGYGSGSAAPAAASTSMAATDPDVVEVKVSGHTFEPQEVHIKKNQTVRWVWVSGVHNVISGAACLPDGHFGSGNTVSGATFEHKFDAAGQFPYFCDPHCSIGMKGLVVVE